MFRYFISVRPVDNQTEQIDRQTDGQTSSLETAGPRARRQRGLREKGPSRHPDEAVGGAEEVMGELITEKNLHRTVFAILGPGSRAGISRSGEEEREEQREKG